MNEFIKYDNSTIYHGDCLEVMDMLIEQGVKVDMILTDPPYNITSMKWDKEINLSLLWEKYNKIIKSNGVIAIFCSSLFTYKLIESNIDNFKYKLIWHKNVPTGMSSAKYRPMKYYEEICIFCKEKGTYNPIMKPRVGDKKECYNYNHYCGNNNHIELNKIKKKYDPEWVNPSDVLEFNVVPNRKNKFHPTQKPTELLEWLIKTYSNENEIILDNYMGSGSTCVACQNLNRRFIGIELDDKYFEIADKRIKGEI